ncbi:MAG: addiction module protein [Deltaproteobacteria bacterium]|nr:addiction module protein [Deltaproteobacteria bacterium]
MADPARVLEDALDLPAVERARVARALIASLDCECDEGADEEWRDEVRSRLDRVAADDASLVDWTELRDRLRSSST